MADDLSVNDSDQNPPMVSVTAPDVGSAVGHHHRRLTGAEWPTPAPPFGRPNSYPPNGIVVA